MGLEQTGDRTAAVIDELGETTTTHVSDGVADLASHEDSAGDRPDREIRHERWFGQDPAHLQRPIHDSFDHHRASRNIPTEKIGDINEKR
jgi:hypothetical protein